MTANKAFFTALIFATLLCPQVFAQLPAEQGGGGTVAEGETPDERAARLFEDPLRGVVVNRTITVQGQEFYQFFSMRWSYIAGESSYTLSVHERPSARWGSEIWVEYQRDRVFHMFLPPIRSETKAISQEAAEIVLETIQEIDLQRALFFSEDLGPEEM